ncbi:MAG: hypothetical protein JXR94_03340 [Candidatus Hydrogenedentes bacterium]|nr:hypothetical protein [Candidatus Hydrogenedentota bacterium]
MISKFREVERAVAYLCQGLSGEFGPGWFEASLYSDGVTRVRSVIAEYANLRPLLERFCLRFEQASVIVEPGRASVPPIMAIQCRCNHGEVRRCGRYCEHHEDRPTVIVLFCAGANPPSDEQRQAALQAFHERMRQFQKADKRKQPGRSH